MRMPLIVWRLPSPSVFVTQLGDGVGGPSHWVSTERNAREVVADLGAAPSIINEEELVLEGHHHHPFGRQLKRSRRAKNGKSYWANYSISDPCSIFILFHSFFETKLCRSIITQQRGKLESPKRERRTVTFGKTWNKINFGPSHSRRARVSQILSP